jgi:hypothetical protein
MEGAEVERIKVVLDNLARHETDKRSREAGSWRRITQNIVAEIEEAIETYQETVEDFRASGLTLNQLEAEGGLRSLITLKKFITEMIESEGLSLED